ncbi:MAG: 2-oxoglutarate dehydrogenase E1 component, partial [Alphaproteobacteria bacterium]|nr:2-oxoglutarate dehydrogenase E1 component [Alphaproteobacteria bacterium]
LTGANGAFIAELYERWRADPRAVDASWQAVFDGLADDAASVGAEILGPSWARAPRAKVIGIAEPEAPAAKRNGKATNGAAATVGPSIEHLQAATRDSVRALMLIRAYRIRGHLEANLDPLGLKTIERHPELEPATYGFAEADLDRPIFIDGVLGLTQPTLRQIMQVLRATYCGSIGVEFMHMSDPDQKAWIQERIESIRNQTEFTDKGKKAILERLTAAEKFEQFLDKKYTGTKRFGLEGGEAAIPALEQILKRGSQLGLREVNIGMPHRGRLNVLANFMGKPYAAIFSEFQGQPANPEDVQGSGDVKYHMGTSADREFDGNVVHLSLQANPSHLEAVNPVVLGKVRAKQMQRMQSNAALSREDAMGEVMAILMHGDAAFAGQGIVAESLMLSELKGYRVGGTIHFIVNNQIGFTTAPQYSRSSPYPTDVGKMIMAPIFHVNGDDAEAVVHVARIATEFRQRFKKDVIIDMFCYRRHGHNESDEPSFTQPLMYKAIGGHPTTRAIYAEKLVKEGALNADEAERVATDFQAYLETQFEAARGYKPNKADWLEGKWSGLEVASGEDRRGDTSVTMQLLQEVGAGLTRLPDSHNIHRTLRRILDNKRKMIESGEGLDWATAEALAFGTLLVEGTPVRLSGQDCGRGTFSQRHSVLVDQGSEERYVPLSHLREGQAPFEVIDSPLSEFGVLGFDYGYSLAEPNSLVCWEAQFGDFANGAQIMIDQFICSGESKWLRMSGLVLLLPHGFEGQGPEHSSARLERFLQMSAEDNWQVCNLTTPANYFHALRRQVRRPFRKPLVITTPKSLLRHKLAASALADMGSNTTFHRVLPETAALVVDDKVKRVVLCSGKVYYDLFEEREKRGVKDVALLRVEQLYPFPFRTLEKELARYRKAEVVWVQEESANMGAWHFVDRRIEQALTPIDVKAKRPRYVGRPESASPATGSYKRHGAEQAKLVDEALTT